VFSLRAPASILSRLSPEVKRNQRKVRHFGPIPRHQPWGVSGQRSTPEVGETPCIQHCHLGAVIALTLLLTVQKQQAEWNALRNMTNLPLGLPISAQTAPGSPHFSFMS
jgi:hypothetical protein